MIYNKSCHAVATTLTMLLVVLSAPIVPAQQKITELPARDQALDDADLLPFTDVSSAETPTGRTEKLLIGDLRSYYHSTWGSGGSVTQGNGSAASIVQTISLSGALDPVITYANGITTHTHPLASLGRLQTDTAVRIKEISITPAPPAGYGSIWMKDDSPNIPKFTNDLTQEWFFMIDRAGSAKSWVGNHSFTTNLAAPALVFDDTVNTVRLALDGDRLFHDTNNDGAKGPGEEYIDSTGAITAVGPAFVTGAAFTNGVSSGAGTTMLVWEGNTVDGGDLTLLAPADATLTANNPQITFPSTTGTLVASGDTGTVTSTMLLDGTILEADLDATNAPADNQVLTYNAAGGNFTWENDATGGSPTFDTIGNPAAPSVIAFDDTETVTLNSAEDAGVFWNFHMTDTSMSAAQTSVLIDSSGNDDPNWIPFLIQDNSGGGPDDLFKVDYAGNVTAAGDFDVDNLNANKLVFASNDISPAATGEMLYDNTITGLRNGALSWYDSVRARTLVGLTGSDGAGTALAAGDDGKVVRYVWNAGNGYFDLVAQSGGTAFSALTGGTNTAAAMVVGTGASLGASGTGTVTATGVDAVGAAGITIGSPDVTDVTYSVNGTGTATVVLPAGAVDTAEVLNDSLTFDDVDHTATIAGNPNLAIHQVWGGAEGLIFEASVADNNEGLLQSPALTGDRIWTLPTLSGTLIGSGDSASMPFGVPIRTYTLAGDPTFAANTAFWASTGIIYEGSANDGVEGLLRWNVATSDKTLDLPNVDGTLISTGDSGTITFGMLNKTYTLLGDPGFAVNTANWGANGILFEGSADDTVEGLLRWNVTSSDKTIDLPDVTGTVVTTGDTGTVTGTMVANDTIQEIDLNATNAPADNQVLTYNAAGGNFTWENDATGSTPAFNTIADATGASVIGFDDGETVTLNSAEDAGVFWNFHMTDTSMSAAQTSVLIDSAGNDDPNWVPFLIQDNSGGGPDDLFKVDYAGNVTAAGNFDVANLSADKLVFANVDASPAAVGEFLYDNAITGLRSGAITWHDGTRVRSLMGLTGSDGAGTALAAGDDGKVVRYVWNAGNGYFDLVSQTAGSSFSTLTSGTNTAAAMTVGSGASLGASGTGTVTATALDAVGVGAIAIGSPDVTSVTIDTDGIGDGELVLPDGSVSGLEILDNTVGFDDVNHTINLGGNPALASSQAYWGSLGIIFEGSTPDGLEGLLQTEDITGADRTWTLPDVDGTIITSGDNGTVSGTMIANSTILEADLDATNAPADNQVLTYNAAGGNFTWENDATGGTPTFNSIADATGASVIGFDDGETVTLNSAEDAGPFWTFHMTDASMSAAQTSVLIDSVGNDDPNWTPLLVQDNSGGTPDDLFKVDFGGNVTAAGGVSASKVTFPNVDASPTTTGELRYDNTITGLRNGALTWYDSVRARTLVGLTGSNGAGLDFQLADDGKVLRYNWNSGNGYFDLVAQSGGSGTITAVGPAYSTGAAFTDGVSSGAGTTMLVWEGNTVDAGDLTLIAPADATLTANNPQITFPSTTGTLATVGGSIGAATATTPAVDDNTTKVATTAYVQGEIGRPDINKVSLTGTWVAPITTNGYNLASADAWGGTIFYAPSVNNGVINLPVGVAGMNIIIYQNHATNAMSIDPNGTEIMVRDGTAQAGGNKINLTAGVGNYVGMVHTGSRWVTLGYKGTLSDGGA